MTMRPMCFVSFRPMLVQVFPAFVDLYTPSPHDTLLRGLASPVPTHTVSGLFGSTATSPMETVASWSNTGSHVTPLFDDLKRPPDAVAAYMRYGNSPATAKSTTRPPAPAGPILRHDRFLSIDSSNCARATELR